MTDVTLTASQYRLIEQHARSLPYPERASFRHSVLHRLRGEPSWLAIETAISVVLERRPLFMCADSTATKGVEP